jgi:hypothetical protein
MHMQHPEDFQLSAAAGKACTNTPKDLASKCALALSQRELHSDGKKEIHATYLCLLPTLQ